MPRAINTFFKQTQVDILTTLPKHTMPQRFVEILDVHAEANTLFNAVAAKATNLTTNLPNISKFIDTTTGVFDSKIVDVLSHYNMSKDEIYAVMSNLNLQMSNTTFAHIERPRPIPAYMMAIGSALIFAHLVLVHVQSRILVKQYGHHNRVD